MNTTNTLTNKGSSTQPFWSIPRRMAVSTSIHILMCTSLLIVLSFVTSYIVSIKTGHNDPRNVLLFLGILRGWMTVLAVAILVDLIAVMSPRLLGYRSMITTGICIILVGTYHLLNLNNPNVELFKVGLLIVIAVNMKDTFKHLFLSFIFRQCPKSRYRSVETYINVELSCLDKSNNNKS